MASLLSLAFPLLVGAGPGAARHGLCNVSTPQSTWAGVRPDAVASLEWKAKCLEVGESDLVDFLRRSEAAQLHHVLGLEAAFFMLAMSLAQCALGIHGAVGEIGATWAAGKSGEESGLLSFEAMAMFRQPKERLLLVGPFEGHPHDGFKIPAQGFGPRSWLAGEPRELHRLAGIADLTDSEMLRQVGTGFRLLRLDRCVGANETLQLLRASRCALAEGGLLVFEGLAAVSSRPGLQEGFHRFMLEESSSGRSDRLVPFLWGGKLGGLFLTSASWAATYRQRVWQALPHQNMLNAVHDTKFLYGSQVLYTVAWEPTSEHMKAYLNSWRPITSREPPEL